MFAGIFEGLDWIGVLVCVKRRGEERRGEEREGVYGDIYIFQVVITRLSPPSQSFHAFHSISNTACRY